MPMLRHANVSVARAGVGLERRDAGARTCAVPMHAYIARDVHPRIPGIVMHVIMSARRAQACERTHASVHAYVTSSIRGQFCGGRRDQASKLGSQRQGLQSRVHK